MVAFFWTPTLAGVSVAIALVFSAWALLQSFLGTNKKKWKLPLPPLASGIPLIGDTFDFVKLGPYFGARHHARHGRIYRGYLLGEQIVHVGDGDALKQLLAGEHKLVEADWPGTIQTLMGSKTIALITHQRHLDVRKMLLPAFSPKTQLQYIPRITEIAEEMCADWTKAQQIKGEHGMKAFTGKIVTELVLGFDKSFATPQLLAHQQQLFDDLHAGLIALPINLPGMAFHKAIKAREAIAALYRENIRRLTEDIDRPTDGRVVTSMEMVVKAARNSQDDYYDMQFLEDTCFHLLFAGHDTSASALTMLLRYLKQEPQVMQRLRQEQQQVIRKHGKTITADYLADMPYAEMTVRETLRLAVVINGLVRRAQTTFECGGYTIPKGMKVSLEFWKVLQDDPRWMGLTGDLAPTKFNPDRWVDADKAIPFFAFSGGARQCPGQGFAYQEIKIMLAVLARSYDWDLDLSEPVKLFPFTVPEQGCPLTFFRTSHNLEPES